ncbi:hypothetical protein OBBRIDRAFT_795878 [Obba rivulosa]|uniref:Uncharacterized protein n=1 Tax=Obba rivulosa TaxID=1052685 RepID=A0A8E2ASY6_9APHY|nr:hypothetical protein OBBRIDRAFT_795878 [Obba rivulosa]
MHPNPHYSGPSGAGRGQRQPSGRPGAGHGQPGQPPARPMGPVGAGSGQGPISYNAPPLPPGGMHHSGVPYMGRGAVVPTQSFPPGVGMPSYAPTPASGYITIPGSGSGYVQPLGVSGIHGGPMSAYQPSQTIPGAGPQAQATSPPRQPPYQAHPIPIGAQTHRAPHPTQELHVEGYAHTHGQQTYPLPGQLPLFSSGAGNPAGLTYADIRKRLGFHKSLDKAASLFPPGDLMEAGWEFRISKEAGYTKTSGIRVNNDIANRLYQIRAEYIPPLDDWEGYTQCLQVRNESQEYMGSWTVRVDDSVAFWDKIFCAHRHANSLCEQKWSTPHNRAMLRAVADGPKQPHLFIRDGVTLRQLTSIHAFEHLFATHHIDNPGEMHVEKAIGSAILSVFNDATLEPFESSRGRAPPVWKCTTNTEITFPHGLKGSKAGGCRPDLAVQARRDSNTAVVHDAVVFVAEAKRLNLKPLQTATQMAFAIHCTLIMLIIQHHRKHNWDFGDLNEEQANQPLPSNFFIFSICYWANGIYIFANYPTLVAKDEGSAKRYKWRLRCDLVRAYGLEQPFLTYRQKFCLYGAILAVEQQAANLKHLFSAADYRLVQEDQYDLARRIVRQGEYNRGKADLAFFKYLQDADQRT